jgi:hypothetical protein
VVPPICTPLLARSIAPCAATLELVPSSLDSTPPGVVSTAPHQVALAVPPGFLPRVAPAPPAAPRADPVTPAASCVAPATLASPAMHLGPPPWVWPTSPIAYVRRPRQHVAPAAPALPTLTPAHRPVTAVPVTPPVNPHWMVTRVKAGFQMPRAPLALTTTTTATPPSPISTSIRAALTDPNWRATIVGRV